MRIAIVAALAVVASLAAGTGASAQDLRIGTINLQRALNESTAGKNAKVRFKEQLDRLQRDLEKQKNEVDSLKDQLAKKALVMKEEERRGLEQEYQRKLREFERAYEDSQGELQQRDAELTRELVAELQSIIQDYGRRGGYTVILEQAGGAMLYGAPHIDVTDAIIAEFNQKR
jgi:outer membrane protein